MTIATLMGTCLVFVGLRWTADVYQPMALCVGAMVCIAAANAGGTSQDLKTGFLVGATPRAQQIGLLIGVVTATLVVGVTIRVLDRPPHHLIGSDLYPAPQATLMATLIKGLLSFNLDWQFVMVGVALAATVELCGVGSLSFAVGAYLPLSTTSPIFVGGLVRALADRAARQRGEAVAAHRGRARPRQSLRHRPGRGRRGRRRGHRARDRDRPRGARRQRAVDRERPHAHAGRRRLPDPGARLLRGDGGDALARGAPARRQQVASPRSRSMVHGGISSTRRRPPMNHNACKAKIDKLWKETSGHLATAPQALRVPLHRLFRSVIDLIEVKNVCVLHLYEVPDAVPTAPRKRAA